MTHFRTGEKPDMDLGTTYLADVAERLASLRRTAERAAAQVDDRAFFAAPDAETNSIAINLKHVGGNLRSRFTDFLTSDGEKRDRHRDGEFVVAPGETRADIEAAWARGWAQLEATLASLTPDDLLHHPRPRRGADGGQRAEPAHRPPRRPHGPDHAARQALCGRRLADAQHPPWPVGDVQALGRVTPCQTGDARSRSTGR